MLQLRALAGAALLSLGFATAAHATVVPVTQANQWYVFDVDDQFGAPPPDVRQWFDAGGYGDLGSALSFTFTLGQAAELWVVDSSIAGDTFRVAVNGIDYFTSSVAPGSGAFASTFDEAWANGSFSRLVLPLGPGTYTVTGFLDQLQSSDPLAAGVTNGAILVTPEPSTWVALAAGLVLLVGVARRRA